MGNLTYSKGISWIDDCRIPFVDDVSFDKIVIRKDGPYGGSSYHDSATRYTNDKCDYNNQGRFPANILVSDDMLNDGVISKSVRGRNDIGSSTYGGNSLLNSKTKMNNTDRGFNDKGTNSRYYDIDKWFEKLLDV